MSAQDKHDQMIADLQLKIEQKREALGKAQKFTPITNCSLELDGTRYNINTLDRNGTAFLLIKLNALEMSRKDLGLDEMMIMSWTFAQWMQDLKARFAYLNRKDEEAKLKTLENSLKNLLSTDAKVALELKNIADMIG